MRNLFPRERQILGLLAQGVTYEQITVKLGINRSTLHTTCFSIRKKTGIRNTKDASECANYTRLNVQPMFPRKESGPTRAQMALFHRLADGQTYEQIAKLRGVSIGTLWNVCSAGCRRAGITVSGYARLLAIKDYVARLEGNTTTSADPMSDPAF